MAATAGSLFNLHADRIEEVINKNIEIFLPSLDPMWRDTVVTSQGVGPADAIGRDMHILKTYMGSMAGVLEQGRPRNDVGLYGDDTDQRGYRLYEQNLAQTWPDPLNGPNAMPFRLGIPMRSMMSNIMFTLGELQAEAIPAFIGDVIAPKLEGFAKNISHTMCNYWYLNQNDNYQLSTVTSKASVVDLTGSVGGYEVTFTPGNGAVDRYYVGQSVDCYDSSFTVRKNDENAEGSQTISSRRAVYVSRVDELKGTVTINSPVNPETDNASNWEGGAIADGDLIVYANSDHVLGGTNATTGLAGINSWLKGGSGSNDNFLLGAERDTNNAIDVTVHPEFKSFTKASVGTLTEHKLRQYLRRFHAAKNKYGQYIDCLVASDGVWLAYEATKIGRETLDRTGRLSSMTSEGSQDGFQFSYDGRSYTGYTSTYVADGEVYGLRKGGNNWKRYVPPTPAGYTSFDKADSFVPFNFIAGALTGTGTNKLPIYNTSGSTSLVTEGVQMPGLLRMQLVPDQAAGMKLTGCTTDQIYSDN